jgi:peptidyl-tRNA hydrolase, PTH1 family
MLRKKKRKNNPIHYCCLNPLPKTGDFFILIFVPMNKLLIVGLGNPGSEYDNTRHNIGFKILDEFVSFLKVPFKVSRLAFAAEGKIKSKAYVVIKPTTFMNLSGKAVKYYLQDEKVPLNNLLVILDDIALPIGTIRLRAKGSDGGHNGLKSINEALGSDNYARLRFGIGSDYTKGTQVNFVLGKWANEELKIILPKIDIVKEAIKDFGLMGIEKTMNAYNNK